MMSIRIAIIEDDEIIRSSYTKLLADTALYEIVGSFSSFESAAENLNAADPDVVLLDINLPGKSGTEALPLISKLVPGARVIMLTVFDDTDTVLKAFRNGAGGYLTKNSSPVQIADAINEVMKGGGPMSTEISSRVIQTFQKNPDTPLSARETGILELIAAGKSRLSISAELFIDPETIKSHLKNIYLKLGVHSKEDAIRIAKTKKFI